MESNISLQGSKSSAIEINKVLKNTYMLLSMTLAFSAVTAAISMAMNLPRGAATARNKGGMPFKSIRRKGTRLPAFAALALEVFFVLAFDLDLAPCN